MNIANLLFGVPSRSTIPSSTASKVKVEIPSLNEEVKSYKNVLTLRELQEFVQSLLAMDAKIVAFDFECSPLEDHRNEKSAALDPHRSEITGISFSHSPNTAIYIPLTHKTGRNYIDNQKELFRYLKETIFENKSILKVAHNLSYESMYLYKLGIIPQQPLFDTIAAAQLSLKNPLEFRELKDSGLKTLTEQLWNIGQMTYEAVTGGRHFDELDPQGELTLQYACADSDYTLQLYYYFKEWFSMNIPKHYNICLEIESPTSVYTGIMKYNGLGVDRVLMEQKQKEAELRLSELKEKIHHFAGREINIGANASTNDFKAYLYNELNLPILKTTAKHAEAADDETFIMLKDWCRENNPEIVAFLEMIQEYRKCAKIKSTYIDGYIQHIHLVTGRIHAEPMPLKTDTGRFAYSKPNLQNMPRKDNDPIGVRNFFKPRDGYVYLDFDFSQIELRVGAYFCRDEKMLETYRNDGDIHGITTTVIYNIPLEQAVDKHAPHHKERRTIAKNVNFGAFFGLFPKGLQRTLKFKAGIEKTEKECEQIIYNIKRGYPELAKWQERTKKEAARIGYTETALGRRRILKGIRSTEWGVKSFWERCALNTPIQGTAADILKLALGRIIAGLTDRTYIKPVLQVHDELLFEVEEDQIDNAILFIQSCMEEKPFEQFDVQIVSEGAVGTSFGEMEELV